MVVMVSAFHDPVDQVRGTLAGAEGYLGKPLDLVELDRLLGRQGFYRQLGPAASGPRPSAPDRR
jgi:CheY-like chemotaxis protein